MQNADMVLGVLRERGRRGLPIEELYRQLFNPQLYLLAYGRIYANHGAMTPGVTQETVDGMSLGKIGRIIDAMRHERYRFSPVRRTYIPKHNGKRRPLGLPTWTDKLVGEVVRLLLEAYYEPTFSDRSHGFRPGRGCHTALREVAIGWKATTWFIEADIADCFGSFDHQVMLSILGEEHPRQPVPAADAQHAPSRIPGGLGLERHPQRSSAGRRRVPILSSIYLHKLDQFVETVLIPEYTRGTTWASFRPYERVKSAIKQARGRGDRSQTRHLRQQLRGLPSRDPFDPGYRRLKYVRYADDHLLGFGAAVARGPGS